ncbi:MAG: succinylglutamate desuccinylase/aspartoacylase family protein [Candidatus Firestonebacteria bacterium]
MKINDVLKDNFTGGKIIHSAIEVNNFRYKVKIPVVIAKGKRRGATLGVVCMQHGLEINGMEVMRRIFNWINPEKLNGNLICVSTANPLAASIRKQAYPTDKEWNTGRPFCDMNRLWPGKSKGNIIEKMAHKIYQEVIKNIDFLIDFHSHQTVYGPLAMFTEGDKSNLKFAESLGLKRIFSGKRKNGKLNSTLVNYAHAHLQIPSCVIELPPLRLIDDYNVKIGEAAIRNALIYTKIIKGKLQPPYLQTIVKKDQIKKTIFKSDYNGIFIKRRKAGDIVKKGEIIGEVVGFGGFNYIQEIVAPYDDSLIISLGKFPGSLREHETDAVKKGDCVCDITRDFENILKNKK